MPRRLLAPLLLLTLLTGCGGGSSPGKDPAAPIATKAPVTLQAGLLGDEASAGRSASYAPTGTIVGDSGFRPAADGFAFENYGNDAGPVNLQPANVEHIFGPDVCAVGTGTGCELIPAAKQWMAQENEAMAGGHCMGFSVTALRFFDKTLKASAFGADTTIALPIQDNAPLQSLIAEDFAYQSLPAVTDRTVEGTPTKVLAALVAALEDKQEQYTLGIFKADGTGGHAITPFAVEDQGGGRSQILVYDNNFPGAVRAVDVDTEKDTWRYVGGTNPKDVDELYAGDASTRSMALLPTRPGEGRQPCPFCPAKPKADPAYPVPDRLKYVEVALKGTDANHPHLLFQDEQGRKTGFTGGRFVQEIPGVSVVQSYAVENWQAGAEPKFHLPSKHPQYIVTVDGTDLSEPVRSRITVNGAGVVFYVDAPRIVPGQKDTLILPASDLGIAYLSGRAKFPGSVTLGAQFPQFDRLGRASSDLRVNLISLAAGWIGLKPGDPIQLLLNPRTGVAEVASTGGTRLTDDATFALSLGSKPLTGGRERDYLGQVKGVASEAGQSLHVHYLRPKGSSLPVDVLDRAGREVRQVRLPAQ